MGSSIWEDLKGIEDEWEAKITEGKVGTKTLEEQNIHSPKI